MLLQFLSIMKIVHVLAQYKHDVLTPVQWVLQKQPWAGAVSSKVLASELASMPVVNNKLPAVHVRGRNEGACGEGPSACTAVGHDAPQ